MLGNLGRWLGGLLGRTRGDGAAVTGDAAAQLETFQEALRTVSPDYARYWQLEGDDAAEAAARTIYAALPATGKVSRTAVAREFLLRLARDGGEEEDVEILEGLSDRQLAIAARRAGLAI
jgi:hypothetical protein